MPSRWILNLVLLAVVGVLAALVIIDPGRDGPPAPPSISVQDPAGVSRVSVRRADGPAIELERREGDRWFLTAPLELPANAFKVRTLLEVATSPGHAQVEEAAADPARFGLAEPRVRLMLDQREYAFGDTQPLSGRRYVRVEGAVYLIDDDAWHVVEGSAAGLVDPSLLPRGAEPVGLALPGLTIRRADAGWAADPERADLGADDFESLVAAWRDAQALMVTDYDPEAGGEQAVRVWTAGTEAPYIFELRKRDYETVFGRPDLGVEYHLSPVAASRLLAPDPPPAEAPAGR